MTIPDKEGCFSRPDDTEEGFRAVAASWAMPCGSSAYPPQVREIFLKRFGIDLGAIPLIASSKGLMPWELACCWIDEEGRGSIQMRPSVGPQSRVPLDVVLVHEAVHAVRGRLDSSKFEEYIAYAASRDAFPESFPRWRAYLGPLFSSVREVSSLFFLLCGSWAVPLCTSIGAWTVVGIDGAIMGLFFARLQYRWSVWNRAFRTVSSAWPATAWKLMIRMADDEVEWLSKASCIREDVAKKASQEWRWHYFLDHLLS